MKGFVDDIEELTEANSNFRRVLYTAKKMQLVVMALRAGEEIGEEVHSDRDQFFRLETGHGEISIDGTVSKIKTGTAMIVPAGARHNIKNTGDKPLKLYTLYAHRTTSTEWCTPQRQLLRHRKSTLTVRQLSNCPSRACAMRV